jgi:hypothetical protein
MLIETVPSLATTPSRSTKLLAGRSSRGINCYFRCKCVLSYKCHVAKLTKENGTSSLEEDKSLTALLKHQSLPSIGLPYQPGITFANSKRPCQRLIPESPMQ